MLLLPSSILYGALSRRVKRECFIAPLEELWPEFLASPRFQCVMNHYRQNSNDELLVVSDTTLATTTTQEDDDEEEEGEVLDQWLLALREACYIWKVVVYDEQQLFRRSGNDNTTNDTLSVCDDQRNMWETICFLIKGAFCVANNISLRGLETKSREQFLLHATVGILPLCLKDKHDNERCTIVFGRILKLYPHQLSQPGPVLDRFPLHMAAANPCTTTTTTTTATRQLGVLPSKVLLPNNSNNSNLSVAMLSAMIQHSPPFVASIPDLDGNYPIHLACASGYSWVRGLEDLFRAAPHVAKVSHRPNLFVLMAQGRSHFQPNNSANSGCKTRIIRKQWLVLCKRVHKIVSRRRRNNNQVATNRRRKTTAKSLGGHDRELEIVNTVFQILSTDPELVLSLVQ